jgi:UDPglucose 6-dehydrogenase
MSQRVGIVGLSHLGIVAGAGLASMGFEVTAVDEAERVAALVAGRLPVHEPGLEDLLARSAPAFTADYAALKSCDVVIVALDTVTDELNRSDLSVLDACVDRALPWLPADGVVALMSQVPVGYTRALATRLRSRRPDLKARVYYWVETLVIGEALVRYLRPERIIIGGPEARAGEPAAAEPALDALLERFGCPVFRMNYESAELCKAAINLYLSVSVTYANTLADLCEATGASMRALIPALRGDKRIGPAAYIRPGLGIAGGNLERDLVHLRELGRSKGVDASLVDLILERSGSRYAWLAQAVKRALGQAALKPGARPRIALWGLAYKKNSRSTKNAVSQRLIADLTGRAAIVAYDPAVTEAPAGIEVAPSALDACRGADALVIVTDWDEFATVDPAAIGAALKCRIVIDAAGVLDPARAREAGLTHLAIGEAP